LEPAIRAYFEPRFGYDFSQVRVHSDREAAASARGLNAQAFTIGSDILFGAGRYQPETAVGRRLLAHELTHVVQQGRSAPLKRVVHRAVIDPIPATREQGPTRPGLTEQAGATARLLRLIEILERIHAGATHALNANQSEEDSAASASPSPEARGRAQEQRDVGAMPGLIARLRAVAEGSDGTMKLQVLAAFTRDRLEAAEIQVTSVTIREARPESIAAAALEISHPQDPAEREADQVAALVLSGAPAKVGQAISGQMISRQGGEAVMAAGEALFAFEAGGGAEVEAATGPPGWIVGGVVIAAAALLVGTGYILMSQHGRGNVSDTGIEQEARSLIAAGTAATMCAALALLMELARRAGDTARMQRIKRTQKAHDCRGHRDG
jgi:hypothetical protein